MDMKKVSAVLRTVLPLKYCGAVIVAAGSASRMGGIDKVMAQLDGEPMICRTVRAFQTAPAIREIVMSRETTVRTLLDFYLSVYKKLEEEEASAQ